MPSVQSTVVLLTGRRAAWPPTARYATDPGGLASGVEFCVEPVYQRTVAELQARGVLLWSVFAPLAVDADAATLRPVAEQIVRADLSLDDRAELAAAMAVLAEANPRRSGLRSVVEAWFPEELIVKNFIYRRGFEDGVEQGVAQGLQQGVAQGLEVGLAPLVHLWERRLGRPPTETERLTLRARLDSVGPDRLGDVVLDLAPDALAAWLADPAAR